MPVVTRRKARKEYVCSYPGCGHKIEKGEEYFYVSKRFQRPHHRCLQHRPRPSELATSDKLSRIYGAREAIQDNLKGMKLSVSCFETLLSSLEDAVSTAEDVGCEYEESADNIEEYFPGTERVEEIREKAESCEDWRSELEDVQEKVDSFLEELRANEQLITEEKVPEPEEVSKKEPSKHEQVEEEDKLEELQCEMDEIISGVESAIDSLNL